MLKTSVKTQDASPTMNCRHTPLPAARYLFHQRRFGAGLFLFDQRQPGVYFTPTVERLRWACPGSL